MLMSALIQLHSRFLDRCIPPALRTDADNRARCRLLIGVIIYGSVSCAAMAGVRYYSQGWAPGTLVVTLAIPWLLACLAVFRKTLNTRLTGDLFVSFALAVLVATAVTDQGLQSRVLAWFVSLPILANFIGGYLRAFRVTMCAVTVLLMLLVAHQQAWLIPLDVQGEMAGRMVATIGGMLFTAAIAYQYDDSRRLADAERARLEAERQNWMAIVSHELRTPLTAIHGALSLIEGGAIEPGGKQATNIIAMAQKNTQRLIRLANDVLDVEKLESNELQLRRTQLDLADVVIEACENQQYSAIQKDIRITIDAPEPVWTLADYDQLIQVFQNLLSNAIKFSPNGSEVRVAVVRTSDVDRVDVIDQGDGIAPDFASQIFGRFAQADTTGGRKHGGTGLGLHLSRTIVNKLGGQIGYTNETYGCRFYVVLPRPEPISP